MSDIYYVLIINIIVWSGIFGYLVALHKKVSKLKSKLEKEISKDK